MNEDGMRRKMRLVRKILEHVEMQTCEDAIPVPEVRDYSEAEVHYHVGLCQEAGYLVLHQAEHNLQGKKLPGIARLTWDGHEALERMRSGENGP